MPFSTLRSSARAILVVLVLAVAGCDDDCNLEVKTSELPDAVRGQPYAFDLDAKCGGDEWRPTDNSSLPPGITLNEEGQLRGSPTQSGTFTFTVEVLDFHSFETDHAFAGLSLVVVEPGPGTPRSTPTPTPVP